jgi:hypothetical protein
MGLRKFEGAIKKTGMSFYSTEANRGNEERNLRSLRAGRRTKFFIESQRDLLPLFQRNDGGEGRGEEVFIPFAAKTNEKTSSKNFASHLRA